MFYIALLHIPNNLPRLVKKHNKNPVDFPQLYLELFLHRDLLVLRPAFCRTAAEPDREYLRIAVHAKRDFERTQLRAPLRLVSGVYFTWEVESFVIFLRGVSVHRRGEFGPVYRNVYLRDRVSN